MSTRIIKYCYLFFGITFSVINYAQNDVQLFNKLISHDTSAVSSLFSRSDSVRTAVLVSAMYPAGLIQLKDLQKATSSSFQKLISNYSRNKQKELWEITRFPGLLPVLLANHEKPRSELRSLLKNYPEKIKNSALHFVKHDYPTIMEIEKIHQTFVYQYKNIVKDFPAQVKNSLDVLLHDPMALSLLSENIKTTEVLGDLYRKNPTLIKELGDSLHLELAGRHGMEQQYWNGGINKNAVTQKDIKHIAQKYSSDEDYTDEVYGVPNNNPNAVDPIVPYPYWAGYPYWLGSNFWYPYPWWVQIGLYWPFASPYFFFGWAPNFYGSWYFNHPFYYRNHFFSSNYYNHNLGYNNFNSGFNRNFQQFGGRGAGGFVGGRGRR